MYDYLIAGAGLYGAAVARTLADAGKTCLVAERRGHIAGNAYTEPVHGIQVHRYGAHIFHTADEEVWTWVNRFAVFNGFVNSPLARYKNEWYHLPFNMNTFAEMWGISEPEQAREIISRQITDLHITEPANLEEQALSLVGRDVYEKLIRGYTEKQWGRPCNTLPAFIIRRVPCRFTYDNRYFDDPHQGIPVGGYTAMVEKILEGIPVRLNCPYRELIAREPDIARHTVYSGCIDEFFGYRFGALRYRSLRFETEELLQKDYQGNAVVNYTGLEVPFTRIIEHKHFEYGTQPVTVITREYSLEWQPGIEPYYPVNDEENNALYEKYRSYARENTSVFFGGRLGSYRYYNMDQVIRSALDDARILLKNE